MVDTNPPKGDDMETVRHLGQPWQNTGQIDLTLWAETGAHAQDRAHLWAIRQYGPCDLDSVSIYDLGRLAPCEVPGCDHQPAGRTYRITARILQPV